VTIAEMQAWLNDVEAGEEFCAVRKSFETCLHSAETANVLRMMIAPLRGTDVEAFILALGVYMAIAAINQIFEENSLNFVNPVDAVKQ